MMQLASRQPASVILFLAVSQARAVQASFNLLVVKMQGQVVFWAQRNDSWAHTRGSMILPKTQTEGPYCWMSELATSLRAVRFCRFMGRTITQDQFCRRQAPASQKEWKLLEVPFRMITFSALPPMSPLGQVVLQSATECRGWWMSPTRCTTQRAQRARSAVFLSRFYCRTLEASAIIPSELTVPSVQLITGTTVSATQGLHTTTSIEEIHAVGSALEIVGPAGGLDEGAGAVVAELVDGGDQGAEVDGGVGVELAEPDLCDGCGEHVADVPPGSGQGRQNEQQQHFHDDKSIQMIAIEFNQQYDSSSITWD